MIKKVNINSDVYFIYDFIHLNGKIKRLYAKSEKEIQEKIKKAEQEEQLYFSICKSKTTNFIECIKSCIDDFSLIGVPKSKIKQLDFLFSTLNHRCFYKSIYDVEKEELQNLFYDLSKLYSNKTINYIYDIIKKVFKIYDADFPEIQIVPYADCDIEMIMLPQEYELMIEFCKHSLKFGKKKEIILFSLLTGLPFSVLCDMKKENINLTSNKIEKDNQSYPLNKKARKWIAETFKYYQKDDYLFLNEKNQLIKLANVCQTMNKIVEFLYLPCKIKGKTLQKSFVIWCQHYNIVDENNLIEEFKYSSKEISFIQNEYLKRKSLFSP